MQNRQKPQSGQPELTTEETNIEETNTEETNTEETDDHRTEKPATEVMHSMEELLKKAELDAAEHNEAWLRAKADTENIRNRAQINMANAHK